MLGRFQSSFAMLLYSGVCLQACALLTTRDYVIDNTEQSICKLQITLLNEIRTTIGQTRNLSELNFIMNAIRKMKCDRA
jgi:hypothetical protein